MFILHRRQGNKKEVQGVEWQRHSRQKEQYFEMNDLFGA